MRESFTINGKTANHLFSQKWRVPLIRPQCMLSLHSCLTLWDTCTVVSQALLYMRFSKGYWSVSLCHLPGDLSDPRIEPVSLMSPALVGRFFTTSATWEAQDHRGQAYRRFFLPPEFPMWSLQTLHLKSALCIILLPIPLLNHSLQYVSAHQAMNPSISLKWQYSFIMRCVTLIVSLCYGMPW